MGVRKRSVDGQERTVDRPKAMSGLPDPREPRGDCSRYMISRLDDTEFHVDSGLMKVLPPLSTSQLSRVAFLGIGVVLM